MPDLVPGRLTQQETQTCILSVRGYVALASDLCKTITASPVHSRPTEHQVLSRTPIGEFGVCQQHERECFRKRVLALPSFETRAQFNAAVLFQESVQSRFTGMCWPRLLNLASARGSEVLIFRSITRAARRPTEGMERCVPSTVFRLSPVSFLVRRRLPGGDRSYGAKHASVRCSLCRGRR